MNKTYIAIDLKSFYASVECRERGLDPMTTHLVVADLSRTEKTICLAVSPALKAYGVPGRPRLFEVVQRVKAINRERQGKAPGGVLRGASWDDRTLQTDPELALDYIVAPPQMARYMACSGEIYNIYLHYVAPEDLHVYSIDEVFLDATSYLKLYQCSAHTLARRMIAHVFRETGITATAGIGPNLYLAKVAMDIYAKRIPPGKDGERIAQLDELSYRCLLWDHQPLTDFWRVGRNYAKTLQRNGLYTMGDVARCSIGGQGDAYNEALLYRLFGVNAELLIDHAWGWEPCTIAQIKAYQPKSNSIGSGQVLQSPYPYEKARLIVREMTELLALDLVDKELITDRVVLTLGYDRENLTGASSYPGEVSKDFYGRAVPKHAHGTARLEQPTASTKEIMEAVMALFERITDPRLLVRRVYLTAEQVVPAGTGSRTAPEEQLDLFTDHAALARQQAEKAAALAQEQRLQRTMLEIKKRFGKNAILKGMNLLEGATTKERNGQVGGHRA